MFIRRFLYISYFVSDYLELPWGKINDVSENLIRLCTQTVQLLSLLPKYINSKTEKDLSEITGILMNR